ncbi:MAG: RHS repeat protein [Thiomargarita sp.]|nr:RHS repeat protein [Thiomargarita sp.]
MYFLAGMSNLGINWLKWTIVYQSNIHQTNVDGVLPYSTSYYITVIAFDMIGGSDYDRLTIIRSKEPLKEIFDDDIAQSDPKESCGRQTGDPIDTATGAQFLGQTLLTVQGIMPISFALEYNSLLTQKGVTGRGWGNQNVSTRLEELDNGDVKIHWTTNRYNLFIKQADGQYDSSHSACLFDQLVKNAEGSFTLSRKNKTVYQFNTQGQLIQRGNQNGQSLTFSYDGDGRLTRTTEPVSGVFLDYAYNNEGLLETVTDPLDRQAKLEYVRG